MTDKQKKPENLNIDICESISMEEFEEAIKGVLLQPVKKRAKYENRKPTKEELNQKWKLERNENGSWEMRKK